MNILQEMRQRRLFFDGGMGSLLQAKGLKAGELPERWNLTHPEEICGIHRMYLQAGSDLITTNTFGANRLKYGEELEKIVSEAVSHAKEAVRAEGHGYVALDLGPTGKLLKPLGDLEFEDAVEIYKETVSYGARAGADLVLIETMSDCYELKAAVLAAKEAGFSPETGERLPIFATVIFDEKGKLLTGGDVSSTVALLEGLGVDVLGINCGLGPVQMKGIVEELLSVSSTPVLVNPNAGLPRSENGETVYDIDAVRFGEVMEEIVKMVGMDALSPTDRLKMEAARSIREDFLHQNSFHEVDTYTSLKKQHMMMRLVNAFYERSVAALGEGASLRKLISMPVREQIGRYKYTKEDELAAEYEKVTRQLAGEIAELLRKEGL